MSSETHETFAENAATQTRIMDEIQEHLNYWIPILMLTNWDISTAYSTNRNESNTRAAAHVEFESCYEHGHMVFYLPNMAHQQEREREEVVVHELCHMVVGPMENRKTKAAELELVVTRMARMFMTLKYKGTEKPST